MIVGCYTLELYCDDPNHVPLFHRTQSDRFEFTADGPKCYSKARQMARMKGWRFTRNNEAICPKCNKKKMSYNWTPASTQQGRERLLELLDSDVEAIIKVKWGKNGRISTANLHNGGYAVDGVIFTFDYEADPLRDVLEFLDPSPTPKADENGLLPKLKWEQTFKADPWDGVSACATYMGLDFHVELRDLLTWLLQKGGNG